MQLKSDNNIEVYYEPSDKKRVFYDNKELMYHLASKGYLDTKRNGDSSLTIMSKPSQIIFEIKEGPNKGKYSVRENVRYLYNAKKVDIHLYKRFVADLESGKISWNFDKNHKIHFTLIPEPFGHQMTIFELMKIATK